jgi:hypothetical protein
MAEMMSLERIAQYAFLGFIVIAIIAGLAIGYMAYDAHIEDYPGSGWLDSDVEDANAWVTLIMLILGIIVGLVSITTKEVTPFLISAIALMVTRVGLDVWLPLEKIHDLLYYWATAILSYFVAFAAPAAVLIAIRQVYTMAREK